MSQTVATNVLNPSGGFPLVLTCEHASREIPPEYNNLGLSEGAIQRHIGWDIGGAHTKYAILKPNANSITCKIYKCNLWRYNCKVLSFITDLTQEKTARSSANRRRLWGTVADLARRVPNSHCNKPWPESMLSF